MKSHVTGFDVLSGIVLLFLAGCSALATPDLPAPTTPPGKTDANMPNPAAVFCKEKGFQLQTRNAADGSQSAVCVFPDGSECDEWAFFRGECGAGTVVPVTENKAVEACKIVVARDTGIDASQITLFSLEKITWPNSCLGIQAPGEVCLSVETPGFRVILTAGTNHYTFHTDLTGENIRREIAGTHP